MSALTLFDWMAQHQETLTWLGGGVATGAGGLWVAVRYLLDRGDKRSEGRSERDKKSASSTVSAGVGAAAGRNQRIGNFTIHQNRIPKSAIGLAALGLLLLGYAAFNSGNRIAVQNGGNVNNSRTEVNAPNGVAAQSITDSPITISPQTPSKGIPR
jgi:hypothetical protein